MVSFSRAFYWPPFFFSPAHYTSTPPVLPFFSRLAEGNDNARPIHRRPVSATWNYGRAVKVRHLSREILSAVTRVLFIGARIARESRAGEPIVPSRNFSLVATVFYEVLGNARLFPRVARVD